MEISANASLETPEKPSPSLETPNGKNDFDLMTSHPGNILRDGFASDELPVLLEALLLI